MLSVIGSIVLRVQNHVCTWKNHYMPNFGKKNRFSLKHWRLENGCYSKNPRGLVCYSSAQNDPMLPSGAETQNAKVIYSVAPAMGHNQVFQTLLCSTTFVFIEG